MLSRRWVIHPFKKKWVFYFETNTVEIVEDRKNVQNEN